MSEFLQRITAADRLLAEAETVEEVTHVADMAETVRIYARRIGAAVPVINRATEIKLRAERKAGELLRGMEKAPPGPKIVRSHGATELSKLGVSKTQSSRWQREALVPEEAFVEYVTLANEAGREITSSGLLKLSNEFSPKNGARKPEPVEGIYTDLEQLVAEGKKFGTIYADPPWRYQNQGTRASTGNHYAGDMSVEEICALPMRELCEPKAHLHLWTTNAFLFECPKIFDAWGFQFKSSFVWAKPQMGIGNYWRNSHEILLLAVRGGQTALSRSEMSWIEHKRGQHSAKPEAVRERIQRLSPGPFLELFGRKPVAGWAVFGNQIVEGLL